MPPVLDFLLVLLAAAGVVMLFFRRTYVWASAVLASLFFTTTVLHLYMMGYFDTAFLSAPSVSFLFFVIPMLLLLVGSWLALASVLLGTRPGWRLWGFVACEGLTVAVVVLQIVLRIDLFSMLPLFCFLPSLAFLSPLCRLRRHPRREAGGETRLLAWRMGSTLLFFCLLLATLFLNSYALLAALVVAGVATSLTLYCGTPAPRLSAILVGGAILVGEIAALWMALGGVGVTFLSVAWHPLAVIAFLLPLWGVRSETEQIRAEAKRIREDGRAPAALWISIPAIPILILTFIHLPYLPIGEIMTVFAVLYAALMVATFFFGRFYLASILSSAAMVSIAVTTAQFAWNIYNEALAQLHLALLAFPVMLTFLWMMPEFYRGRKIEPVPAVEEPLGALRLDEMPTLNAEAVASSRPEPPTSRNEPKLSDLNAEDEKLLRRYHRVVVRDFVAQLIVAVLFLAALLSASIPDAEAVMLVLLGVGCVAALVVRRLFPSGELSRIAQEMMRRRRKAGDVENNPYYYLYRAAGESGVPTRSPGVERTLILLTTVLKVINALLYLLTALIALVLAGVFMVVVGGILWIAYVIFMAGRANGLAMGARRASRLTVIPLRFAISFLGTTLTFADIRTAPSGGAIRAARAALETDPEKMDRTLADLGIDRYLSLDRVVLPGGCQWSGRPSLSASGTRIYVEGEVSMPTSVNETEHNALLTACCNAVTSELTSQVREFHAAHPQASDARVEVELRKSH